MSLFPTLENEALAKVPMWKDKNSNDLEVICLICQTSKFVCCIKWPGSGVPARGSYLGQAAIGNVQIWIQIRKTTQARKLCGVEQHA